MSLSKIPSYFELSSPYAHQTLLYEDFYHNHVNNQDKMNSNFELTMKGIIKHSFCKISSFFKHIKLNDMLSRAWNIGTNARDTMYQFIEKFKQMIKATLGGTFSFLVSPIRTLIQMLLDQIGDVLYNLTPQNFVSLIGMILCIICVSVATLTPRLYMSKWTTIMLSILGLFTMLARNTWANVTTIGILFIWQSIFKNAPQTTTCFNDMPIHLDLNMTLPESSRMKPQVDFTSKEFGEDCREVINKVLLVGALFACAFMGLDLPTNGKMINEILQRHGLLSRAWSSWEMMFDRVAEAFDATWKLITKHYYGAEYASIYSVPEVERLSKRVTQLSYPQEALKIGKDHKIGEEIVALYFQFIKLKQTYVGTPSVSRILDVIAPRLISMYKRVMDKNPRAQKMRQEPVCIMFSGGAGVGKTYLMSCLQQELLKIAGLFPESPEIGEFGGFIYSRTVEQEYWDGYCAQPIVIFDDFGQQIDSPNNPNLEFFELIRSVNIFSWQLHCAAISEKANNPFVSQFVVLTTNLNEISPESVVSKEAVRRRIHLGYKLKCIEEVCKPQTQQLDRQLLAQYRFKNNLSNNDTSHWRFIEHNSVTGHVGRELTYDEIVVQISLQYKLHVADFGDRQKLIENSFDKKLPAGAFTIDEKWRAQADDDRWSDDEEEETKPFFYNEPKYGHLENVYNGEWYHDSTESKLIWLRQMGALSPSDDVTKLVRNISNYENERFYNRNIVPSPHVQRFVLPTCIIPYLTEQMRDQFMTQQYMDHTWFDLFPGGILMMPSYIKPSHKMQRKLRKIYNLWELVHMSQNGYFDQLVESIPMSYRCFLSKMAYKAFMLAHSASLNFSTQDYDGTTVQLFHAQSGEENMGCDVYDRVVNMLYRTKYMHPALKMCSLMMFSAFAFKFLRDAVQMWRFGFGFYSNCIASTSVASVSCNTQENTFDNNEIIDKNEHINKIVSNTIVKPELIVKQNVESPHHNAPRPLIRQNFESPHHNAPRSIVTRQKFEVENKIDNDLKQMFSTESGRSLDTSLKKKKCTYEGVVSEMAFNVGEKIRRNVYNLRFFNGQRYENIGFVLALKGKKALINYHFFQLISNKLNNCIDPTNTHLDFRQPNQDRSHICDLQSIIQSAVRIKRGEVDSEFYGIDLPNSVPLASDITKHFMTLREIERLTNGVQLMMFSYQREGDSFALVQRQGSFQGFWTAEIADLRRSDVYHTYPHSVRYLMNTRSGDCGTPIIAMNDEFAHKLLGVHFCGDDRGFGGCSYFTKEEMMKFVSGQCAEAPLQAIVQSEELTRDFPLYGSFRVLGVVDKPVLQPLKTNLRQSAIFNEVAQTEMAPAILEPALKPDGVMIRGLSKNACPAITLNKRIVDECVISYNEMLSKFPSFDDERRVLTYEEACAGIPGNDFFPPLQRTKSPGWPFCINNQKSGHRGKQKWCGIDEWDFSSSDALELRQLVNQLEDDCAAGLVPEVYFIDTLKDEKRDLERVRQRKTRVFSAAPMHFSILFRKYFLGFIGYMARNRIVNECAVGTNAHSTDWKTITQHLGVQDSGAGLIAGDFSNFDGTVAFDIFDRIVDIINDHYADSDRNKRVRKMLWRCLCNSKHILHHFVYQMAQGQPSGNPSTAVTNSMYVALAIRFIYFLKFNNLSNFQKNVRVLAYGDDVLISVVPSLRESFSPFDVERGFKQIGMTFTDEEKGTQSNNFRSINQVSFLKRSFAYDEKKDYWFAPLKLRSIVEMTNWVRSCSDLETATVQNCEDAERELWHHNEIVYNNIVNKMRSATARLTSRPVFRGYEYGRTLISEGKFAETFKNALWI